MKLCKTQGDKNKENDTYILCSQTAAKPKIKRKFEGSQREKEILYIENKREELRQTYQKLYKPGDTIARSFKKNLST